MSRRQQLVKEAAKKTQKTSRQPNDKVVIGTKPMVNQKNVEIKNKLDENHILEQSKNQFLFEEEECEEI